MYQFTVTVSIRKGLGPEWFEKEFEVYFEDMETPISEEELKEWAKDDVRSKLRNTIDYNHYGDNWIITDIRKK